MLHIKKASFKGPSFNQRAENVTGTRHCNQVTGKPFKKGSAINKYINKYSTLCMLK